MPSYFFLFKIKPIFYSSCLIFVQHSQMRRTYEKPILRFFCVISHISDVQINCLSGKTLRLQTLNNLTKFTQGFKCSPLNLGQTFVWCVLQTNHVQQINYFLPRSLLYVRVFFPFRSHFLWELGESLHRI